MAWSVNLIGTCPKIAEALRGEAARLTGADKLQFDAALPHLLALLALNLDENGSLAFQLGAAGHAVCKDGAVACGTFNVKLIPLIGRIV